MYWSHMRLRCLHENLHGNSYLEWFCLRPSHKFYELTQDRLRVWYCHRSCQLLIKHHKLKHFLFAWYYESSFSECLECPYEHYYKHNFLWPIWPSIWPIIWPIWPKLIFFFWKNMPLRLPEHMKSLVIQQWLQGVPRNDIAAQKITWHIL